MLIGLMCLSTTSRAQDTTTVQTLTFDHGITNLRGWFKFPPKEKTYRKVLAFMTLKCDKDIISNPTNSGCGEWDSGADLAIFHHTGEYDSVRSVLGKYAIDGAFADTFSYLNTPLFNYREKYIYKRSIEQTLSETDVLLGTGNSSLNLNENPENSQYFLWTAKELTDAGLKKGDIHKIAFNIVSSLSTESGLAISYGQTSKSKMTPQELQNLEEVYQFSQKFSGTGFQTITLTQPIEWDGTSNLILTLNYLTSNESVAEVKSDQTTFDSQLNTQKHDGYLKAEGDNYVLSSLNDYQFGDEITVSFWANGNPDELPTPSAIFTCLDSAENTVVSGHVGWNENIRWDSGSHGQVDRCQRKGSASQFTDSWSHWTFTKNIKTGVTRIYLNGNVFYQMAKDFLPVGRINRLVLGTYNEYEVARPYFGKIDEFQMWNAELDAKTIKDWMHKDVDKDHPHRDDLVVYYKFNEGMEVIDHSGNEYHALATHSKTLQKFSADEAFRNIETGTNRPQIQFSQGDYAFKLDSARQTIIEPIEPHSLVEYEATNRKFSIKNMKPVWSPQTTFRYDVDGSILSFTDYKASHSFTKDSVEFYQEPFELTVKWTIAKYITPYGNGLDLGDGFTWVWDVSEFEQYFRDSVDLQAGSHRELIDLKFMMIEGPAPAPLTISKIWENETNKYYLLDNDESRAPVDVSIKPETKHLFLRSALGGHGHASENGEYPHCCEWKNNEHYMYANDKLVDTWHVWKNCGWTALFPQGGTWNGAREGWCPGDIRDHHYTRLTDHVLSNNIINLDYRITPVPENNQRMGNGGYSNDGWYVMQYEKPAFDVDADLVRIISPSDWDIYKRINPVCSSPIIIVRNNGDEDLKTLKITYGVKGGEMQTYNWTGNLKFKDIDTVYLPIDNGVFYDGDGSNTFIATLSGPNGGKDEFGDNNSHSGHFELPDMYDGKILIDFKTNNYPNQNSYYVTNAAGQKVFERTNLEANKRYMDEVVNTYGGCYTFHVTDAANDGLSYWANPPQGSGSVSIRSASNNRLLKSFNSDFGSGIEYSFVVGGLQSIKEPNLENVMNAYPNPTTNVLHVSLNTSSASSELVLLNSVGHVVYKRALSLNDTVVDIDMSSFSAGVYILNWTQDGDVFSKRVVKAK